MIYIMYYPLIPKSIMPNKYSTPRINKIAAPYVTHICVIIEPRGSFYNPVGRDVEFLPCSTYFDIFAPILITNVLNQIAHVFDHGCWSHGFGIISQILALSSTLGIHTSIFTTFTHGQFDLIHL
jgi:hypothetical protein